MGRLVLGTLTYEELNKQGCQLAIPVQMFKALMDALDDDPCTSGCAFYKGGQCPAYKKFYQRGKVMVKSGPPPLVAGKWANMTSEQIRTKEGISRAEFQLRKQRGDYKE